MGTPRRAEASDLDGAWTFTCACAIGDMTYWYTSSRKPWLGRHAALAVRSLWSPAVPSQSQMAHLYSNKCVAHFGWNCIICGLCRCCADSSRHLHTVRNQFQRTAHAPTPTPTRPLGVHNFHPIYIPLKQRTAPHFVPTHATQPCIPAILLYHSQAPSACFRLYTLRGLYGTHHSQPSRSRALGASTPYQHPKMSQNSVDYPEELWNCAESGARPGCE